MGGGLMQLVAYGAQDIYLTGNPQITFFKVVYGRHTNFAVEAIEQTVNGTVKLGSKFSVTVARNGDLLSRVYLEIEWKPQSTSGEQQSCVRSTGFDLIDYVEVEIGGQCIDKQYGEWMSIWCDLTHNADEKSMLNRCMMINLYDDPNSEDTRSYIPLQFWFCRNPGLALPLIALQYHEVKLNVQMKCCYDTTSCCSNDCICNLCVYGDYVFLDTDERRRFAQVSHEYLIEQVQFSNDLTISQGTCNHTAELRFNHPVKELMWVINTHPCNQGCGSGCAVTTETCLKDATDRDAPFGVADTNFERAVDCLIQLNGHDRFKKRQGDYFTDVQRYEHHSGGFVRRVANVPKHVHLYSFALKPEEHQPSGTCNFSRIDNAVLVQTLTPPPTGDNNITSKSLRVYAVNYNVLRIMSGMGGLAYSN